MNNQPVNDQPCSHAAATPKFDVKAAEGLSTEEIRKRWPRFFGPCPSCGASVIAYHSREHYVYGDW